MIKTKNKYDQNPSIPLELPENEGDILPQNSIGFTTPVFPINEVNNNNENEISSTKAEHLYDKLEKLMEDNRHLSLMWNKEKAITKKQRNHIEILQRTVSNIVIKNGKKQHFEQVKEQLCQDENSEEIQKYKKASYADLWLTIPEMKNEITRWNNQLSLLESENRGWKIKNEKYKEQAEIKETKELKYDSVILDNKALQKENEEMKHNISWLEEQIETITKYKEENLKLTNSNKKIVADMCSLQKKNDFYVYENTNWKDEIEKWKTTTADETIITLRQEIKANQAQNEEHSSQITQFKNEIEILNTALQCKDEKIKESNDIITEQITTIEELERKNKETSNQVNELIKDNKNLQSQIDNFSTDISDLHSFKIQSTNDLVSCKNEIDNWNQQLLIVTTEKTKNENYYLSQIAIVQQQKNSLENRMNQLLNKQNNSPYICPSTTGSDKSFVWGGEENNRYHLALQEITSYKNDNKKWYDKVIELKEMIKGNKNDFEFVNNLLKRLLKYHINKEEVIAVINELVHVYGKLSEVNREIKGNKSKWNSYSNFLQIMNNKKMDQSEDKYDYTDYAEIGIIQNNIIRLNHEKDEWNDWQFKWCNDWRKYENKGD